MGKALLLVLLLAACQPTEPVPPPQSVAPAIGGFSLEYYVVLLVLVLVIVVVAERQPTARLVGAGQLVVAGAAVVLAVGFYRSASDSGAFAMRLRTCGLLCASLLAACSAPNETSRPSDSPPRPTASLLCTEADVRELVGSFVRAIDAGDRQAIAATLATNVIFSDDRRQVGGDFARPRARDAIVGYFLERHAAGERFELVRGQANGTRNFEYNLKISVARAGTHSADGKGTTNDPYPDCSEQRIAVWNMVRRP